MIQPKKQTQNLLLSITKNCEAIFEQPHKKPKETLEFKMIKSRETFHFNPPIQIKGDWMIGLTDLEVYNSIFKITKEINKFELHTDPLDSEFSFTEMKGRIAELLDLESITPEDLEHKTTGPDIIEAYRKLLMEESQIDGYYFLLLIYTVSPLRDFESYLRILTGLNEDDIHLILKQYNSKFIT